MGQDTAYDLQRFVNAQDGVFDTALAELRAGSKSSHWMWFIFPQLQSLGRSSTAQYYGIVSLDEARAYLRHAVLGSRLRRAVEALLMWAGKRSPERILGPVDAVKLRSSLTLFDAVEPGAIFAHAIDALFGGERDPMTLELLSPE